MILVLTVMNAVYIFNITVMKNNIPSNKDSKNDALRAAGTQHPNPNVVQDEAFLQGGFFDPNDLVQVKYEMLRRHRDKQKSVTEVAKTFGTSRQAFYAAKALFDNQGIPGLIPKRRGPRGAHKCSEEVLDFAEQWKKLHKTERSSRLSEAIEKRFRISINHRSVDRALVLRKKKRHLKKEKQG